jgi:hypothetical protein
MARRLALIGELKDYGEPRRSAFLQLQHVGAAIPTDVEVGRRAFGERSC